MPQTERIVSLAPKGLSSFSIKSLVIRSSLSMKLIYLPVASLMPWFLAVDCPEFF